MLIAELRDGRRIEVARIGRAEAEDGSDEIAGYEAECPDRDLFGRPVVQTVRLCDIRTFLGMYAFPPKCSGNRNNNQFTY